MKNKVLGVYSSIITVDLIKKHYQRTNQMYKNTKEVLMNMENITII
ncbi:hypothetical protein HCUR_01540 [Holospora curviuscula]|uniref:Uncharacterized protein n=1 Tax=Holospora curviuscula TaxID=1082868 RepID=A0A2S5R6V4_9PROT|nr:hypothetical protein HCUR_01540 [Holospora curviuscula]